MSEGVLRILEVLGALLTVLSYFVASATLAAVTALNPVALRRLALDVPGRVEDAEELDNDSAPQRLALVLLQQASLLLAVGLVADILRRLGANGAFFLSLVGGFAVLVLLVQGLLARWLVIRDPRGTLAWAAGPARVATWPLRPFATVLSKILQSVPADSVISAEEREAREEVEVEALIEVGEREGLLEAEEGEMMRGIVDLDETVVREIMTPRAKIVALPLESTVVEARRMVIDAGHSRLPVYRGSIDHVVGILYARDLFRAWEAGDDALPLAGLIRQASFVAETASAAVLLSGMRQKRPIAMVVDEYGGVSGLITLEDLLEEIVGEIHDEHEVAEEMIQSEDGWSVSAATHVSDIEKLFDRQLGPREFDTVGGLVVSAFGRVPLVGEQVITNGFDIRVLAADARRVHRVRLRLVKDNRESKNNAD